MYFRCLLPVAVEMLFMSTASGSRVGFHIYCHFLVAVEVAVEVAVAFQSGSRKESGSRKVNDRCFIPKIIHCVNLLTLVILVYKIKGTYLISP